MARAIVIAPPFSLILGCLMNGHTCLFNLEKKIKSKPFSVLVASNVIGAIPTGTRWNQPTYEYHVTTADRNRVKAG
jgi:hypothetical protein